MWNLWMCFLAGAVAATALSNHEAMPRGEWISCYIMSAILVSEAVRSVRKEGK